MTAVCLPGLKKTAQLKARAEKDLMQYLASGKLEVIVGQTFPLVEAAEAHRAISDRKTIGKGVLPIESDEGGQLWRPIHRM